MLPHIPLPAHFSAPLKSKIPWVFRTFCLQLFSLILTYSSHVLLHYSTEIVVVISNHHSVNQRSNLSPHLFDLSAAFDTGDHSIFHDTYSSFDIQNSDFVLFPTFSRSCYSQPPFFFFLPPTTFWPLTVDCPKNYGVFTLLYILYSYLSEVIQSQRFNYYLPAVYP